jgi:hypothetical protein
MVAWLGGSVLGVANGVIREKTYGRRLSDETADRISAVSLVKLLALYFRLLDRRWPIPTSRRAFEIGGGWMALTVLFEFGFGHYVARKSWSELAANYDMRQGNLWPLVLLWTGVGPAATRLTRRA